jgi:signal transduction histidine kinase
MTEQVSAPLTAQFFEKSPFATLAASDTTRDSIRLIGTRWFAGGVVLLATAFCTHILKLPLPELPLYSTGVAILLYNGVLTWLMRRAQASGKPWQIKEMRRFVLLQVALDWIAMAVFLHLTGGISSPATPFMIIHMLMITILLPNDSPYPYLAMGLGILAMIALFEGIGWLPHYAVIPDVPVNLYSNPTYVLSRVIFIAITAFAIVYLTSAIMERLRERERQIAALFQSTQAVSSTLSLSEVMERLTESAALALSVPKASIRLLDESGERMTMAAAYGLSQDYVEKGPVLLSHNALVRDVLLGRPIIIHDVMSDPRIQYPQQARDEGIHSSLVVPIIGYGKPLGVLRVYSDEPRHFTDDDAAFLTSIAQQGATALENAMAHDKLQKSDQERAQFVRIVTHELRSPVNGAQSLLRVMMRGMAGELNTQQSDILSRLGKRLDVLHDLIEDLLALAASKTTLYREPLKPLPIQPAIQMVIDQISSEAEEKHVKVEFDAPNGILQVNATQEGLGRIFLNLIGNAVKYTPENGQVSIRVVDQASHVEITVADTGIGIPEKDLPNLWNEFFRASNAKQSGIPGTGLGLSISRQLAERFGGMVGVQSVEGEGTTFKVTLPLASLQEEPA